MTESGDIAFFDAPALRAGGLARTPLGSAGWRRLAERLGRGEFALLSLWAGCGAVHMALLDGDRRRIGIASHDLGEADGFPSVGALHPPAQRLERALCDLHGLSARGAIDDRPWLDHGRWTEAHPLRAEGRAPAAADAAAHPAAAPYAFLPVLGESLHRIYVGPVHAGIIEPGHFRFTAQGETVVRLEARLGYAHKGVDRLMQGATLARGAQLAGRISGDSTVAWAWAFAQAAEAALSVEPPARAVWLRALMAELERLANHIGDVGAICNDAAFAMMHAQCGALRERILRAAATCFGHRFMRDRIVPGGVAADLSEANAALLRALVADLRARFAGLETLYDGAPSLEDRTVGTGRLDPALAAQFAAGGHVGRASGRDFDVRRDFAYAPYDRLSFAVPAFTAGDVDARIRIRMAETRESLSLVEQILDGLPSGPLLAATPDAGSPCEGVGLVESFRGDALAWLALDATGRIARCHLRDPSWMQWPLLEAAIHGNIVADFPLCNKSFNCSYSGHDL